MENKKCPYCHNLIPETAITCPHCNATLDGAEDELISADHEENGVKTKTKCPFCNKEISVYSEKCPYCNADLLLDRLEKTQGYFMDPTLQKIGHTCLLCDSPVPEGVEFCPTCLEIMETSSFMTPKKDKGTNPIAIDQLESKMDGMSSLKEAPLPPPCISDNVFSVDKKLLHLIEEIEPVHAPKAIISDDSGNLFYLYAGTQLTLGREQEGCLIQSILFPEHKYHYRNMNISRTHCRIFINDNQVWIVDTSINGTLLNQKRIPNKNDFLLYDGDIVSLADVLEMKINIFTTTNRITAVKLERKNNTILERHILVHGIVPIGSEPSYPIVIPDTPSLSGIIYYHPIEKEWHFVTPNASTDTFEDKVLDVVEELDIASTTLFFSSIQ